jgi:hypothetical protein
VKVLEARQVDFEFDGEKVVGIQTPNGRMPLFIDERSSHVNVARLTEGDWVVVAPIGTVDNRKIVKVMRMYQPGIRMAIQYYKTGNLMPGSPRHSIIPEEDGNSIMPQDAIDFPFIEGQERNNLKGAPMLTVQLDTLYRAMSAMTAYKRVEILYKDSHTPFLVSPLTTQGDDIVEVVCSALSPFKSGKVVTI